jgi:hypothetical protein
MSISNYISLVMIKQICLFVCFILKDAKLFFCYCDRTQTVGLTDAVHQFSNNEIAEVIQRELNDLYKEQQINTKRQEGP